MRTSGFSPLGEEFERLVLVGAGLHRVMSDTILLDLAGYIRRRIQPVDATHSLNISAGVWKPSVLRGLSFNCLAIALS